uniref:Uncharacterized protein n=1 Tax=Coccidioides posadasii RMSCC 3488 TaxID=454284 RepID=A0A0J6ICJ8_COCPO|nr:hypothetical protein CPAG_05728 [Coccidioides posadasii RMSCC 3488]
MLVLQGPTFESMVATPSPAVCYHRLDGANKHSGTVSPQDPAQSIHTHK